MIPMVKNTSAIRFIIIAFNAALLAKIREYQKFINKYEHKPTPSHPINIWIKLSAVTKISIKKVNKDKKLINLHKKGSFAIYSIEYKWTKKEIQHIINNIIHVKLSNNKPKFKFINSILIHVNKFIITIESLKQTSKYKNKEIKAAMNMHPIDILVLIILPK